MNVNMANSKGLNRIKVVLAEQQRTNRWLAEQLDKGEATISKWCTNRAQPSLEIQRIFYGLLRMNDNLEREYNGRKK